MCVSLMDVFQEKHVELWRSHVLHDKSSTGEQWQGRREVGGRRGGEGGGGRRGGWEEERQGGGGLLWVVRLVSKAVPEAET